MTHAMFELMIKFCFGTIAVFIVLAVVQTFVRNSGRRIDLIDLAQCIFGVGLAVGGCGLLGDSIAGFTNSGGISGALALYAIGYGSYLVVSQIRTRRRRQEIMKRFDKDLK